MRGKIPILLCPLGKANLNHWTIHVKVEVTLRLTVSQSVCLSVEPHLALMIKYLLLFES
jgi:hypothetical protein